MKVEIDSKSGFCFGVKAAIEKAEKALNSGTEIFCLGDIVHNEEEIQRLAKLGLKSINTEQYFKLKNCTVLLRAHGVPPEIYNYAKQNNITIIEGTCPVVLKLQQRIKRAYESDVNQKIVIFGKSNHPEVIGLVGQTNGNAIVISSKDELDLIESTSDISLFAQTTMDKKQYAELQQQLSAKLEKEGCSTLSINQTICGQVSNRGPWLEEFANKYDAIVFVGGKKSSNSKVLYGHCKKVNSNSYFVSSVDDLTTIDFSNIKSVGICGATSTPQWLMEDIAKALKK